jgi:hypothetical protein
MVFTFNAPLSNGDAVSAEHIRSRTRDCKTCRNQLDPKPYPNCDVCRAGRRKQLRMVHESRLLRSVQSQDSSARLLQVSFIATYRTHNSVFAEYSGPCHPCVGFEAGAPRYPDERSESSSILACAEYFRFMPPERTNTHPSSAFRRLPVSPLASHWSRKQSHRVPEQ